MIRFWTNFSAFLNFNFLGDNKAASRDCCEDYRKGCLCRAGQRAQLIDDVGELETWLGLSGSRTEWTAGRRTQSWLWPVKYNRGRGPWKRSRDMNQTCSPCRSCLGSVSAEKMLFACLSFHIQGHPWKLRMREHIKAVAPTGHASSWTHWNWICTWGSCTGCFSPDTLLFTMETIVPEYQSSTPVSPITNTSTI